MSAMNLPAIHLAIMQPLGYVHSLGFLDQARYVRYQFRRMGAAVTISKNRLREDAVNLVFGAHLGFPADWQRRHACVFVNLEQLGQGGASVSPDYLALLRRSAVVDYDAANVPAYAADVADVPLLPFAHAPYLDASLSPPLEDRPIDLLFFGSMNPRRQAFIAEIEAAGVQVTRFDHPVYGAERDHFIRQSKAVLNCHFYDSSRFEQARAFHCLSLGTPVVSERRPATQPPAAFEDAVTWLGAGQVTPFFAQQFGRPAWFERARAQLQRFAGTDPIEAYADLLAFAAGFHQAWGRTRSLEAWRPKQVNLGSGKDYKPGWLNIDILERAEPDIVLDLGQAVSLPLEIDSCRGGRVRLEAGQLDLLYANNVLEHVPDLPTLMGNALTLLKEGGEFQIEVPYEKALSAWQDPTHLRALNENSWLYYTDWFWYLGWFEHRFQIAEFKWLDTNCKPCEKPQAAFMKLSLRKIPTTLRERTTARTLRPDFGGVDDDWCWPDDVPADHRNTNPGAMTAVEAAAAAEPAMALPVAHQEP
jgi:SAM-dependent methyltransferase